MIKVYTNKKLNLIQTIKANRPTYITYKSISARHHRLTRDARLMEALKK
jgi:hypothetical protein